LANKYTRKGRERGDAPVEPLPVNDQFMSLSARGWVAMSPYFRQIGFGLAGLGVALVLAWVILHWREGKRESATEAFGRAVRIYDAELLTSDEKPKADEDVPRFKTAKERSDAALAELDKLARDYGGTPVADRARAVRAGVLYDGGNFAEAQKLWQQVADAAGKDDPMKVVAREGAGLCLENQGKLDEALAFYQELETAGGGFYRDRAQFDRARALAAKGNKPEAEKLWKELLSRVPQGGLHDQIQSRLAALSG
jgi:tetratricopeptide (TPR) repeat protein